MASLHLGFFSATEVLRRCFKAMHSTLTAPPQGRRMFLTPGLFLADGPTLPALLDLVWSCPGEGPHMEIYVPGPHMEMSLGCDRITSSPLSSHWGSEQLLGQAQGAAPGIVSLVSLKEMSDSFVHVPSVRICLGMPLGQELLLLVLKVTRLYTRHLFCQTQEEP